MVQTSCPYRTTPIYQSWYKHPALTGQPPFINHGTNILPLQDNPHLSIMVQTSCPFRTTPSYQSWYKHPVLTRQPPLINHGTNILPLQDNPHLSIMVQTSCHYRTTPIYQSWYKHPVLIDTPYSDGASFVRLITGVRNWTQSIEVDISAQKAQIRPKPHSLSSIINYINILTINSQSTKSYLISKGSAMCVQCGKWIHGRCAEVKWVTSKFQWKFTCRIYITNIRAAVEQKERSCDEVETVREFTYLGDRVSVGGGCEAAVTARTRCGGLSLGSAVSCCMAGDFL